MKTSDEHSLNWQLSVFALAILVPMIALAVVTSIFLARRERDRFRQAAVEQTNALLSTIDGELKSSIRALEGITTSRSLEADDLSAFYAEATQLVRTQPNWTTVILSVPSGQQVINTLLPYGSVLPGALDKGSFEDLLRTGKPVVGELVETKLAKGPGFPVRVPVLRNGVIRYVLSAGVESNAFLAVLRSHMPPSSWVVGILDHTGRIVARSRDSEKFVGRSASKDLLAAVARAPQGWSQGTTLDGTQVYTAYRKSPFSGWTVAIGIPATEFELGARQTIIMMSIGTIAAAVLALWMAILFGRRIAKPISALASAANAMSQGHHPEIPLDAGSAEIAVLAHALKNADQAVKERQAQLDALARFPAENPAPVLRVNRDGSLLYSNPAATLVFDPLAPANRETVMHSITAAVDVSLKSGLKREVELDLAERSFSFVINPILEFGYANAYGFEITERRQAEAALREADRRKDEFIALLSHELRNPLAPISNAVHILKSIDYHDAKLDWSRDLIAEQVAYMARLLEDLLDVSRTTRGRLELRKEPLDLREVIREALSISSPAIIAAGHKLTVFLPPQKAAVHGDRIRLTQVFVNLLNNACKYTLNAGYIWMGAELSSADEVMVRIRDSGMGIAPELLPRIFEMFVHGASDADGAQAGLGIGLSLAREIVRLHGGSITADSAGVGKGSEFIVRLPLAREEVASGELAVASSHPSTDNSPLPAPSPRRVLIVDDLEVQAKSLAMLLELDGFEVRVAFDGERALSIAAESLPDFVLLDLGLPGISGHEVARRIRQMTGAEKIVLIAQTGWGRDEDRQQSRAAGFDFHLTKPIDHSLLQKILCGEVKIQRNTNQ